MIIFFDFRIIQQKLVSKTRKLIVCYQLSDSVNYFDKVDCFIFMFFNDFSHLALLREKQLFLMLMTFNNVLISRYE